jgi:hypothetical protein
LVNFITDKPKPCLREFLRVSHRAKIENFKPQVGKTLKNLMIFVELVARPSVQEE